MILPKYVYWDDVKIKTRRWQIAGMLLWMKSVGLKVYEPETTECFRKYLESAKCFWDIGASVGYFSVLASQRGVKTYTFELDKDFIRVLKKHQKEHNLDIQIIEKPLGRSGQVIEYENYNGISKGNAISADEFLEKTGNFPDLIKVDIDGAEYDFLVGAESLLTEHNPIIIMELSKSKRGKLISKMKEYGYKKIKELDEGSAHNALFLKD